jgi:hypothetical protein
VAVSLLVEPPHPRPAMPGREEIVRLLDPS